MLHHLSTRTSPLVYPIGYSARYALQRVDDLMKDPNMLLIDTRFKPTSQLSQWRKATLERVYGQHYRWMGEYLGNINYNNDLPIELANPEPGIARLCDYLRRGFRLILLCQCPNYRSCHRERIVHMLLNSMPDVRVIQPDTLPQSEGYRCISIRQPYADWFVQQANFAKGGVRPKIIENRDWQTRYRGEILIHAGTTFEYGAFDYWKSRIPGLEALVPRDKKAYTLGAIIGVAQLVAVETYSDDPWFCGTYGFVLQDARPIGPYPYPGALKLFEVPRSVATSTS